MAGGQTDVFMPILKNIKNQNKSGNGFEGGVWLIFLVPEGHFNHFQLGWSEPPPPASPPPFPSFLIFILIFIFYERLEEKLSNKINSFNIF